MFVFSHQFFFSLVFSCLRLWRKYLRLQKNRTVKVPIFSSPPNYTVCGFHQLVQPKTAWTHCERQFSRYFSPWWKYFFGENIYTAWIPMNQDIYQTLSLDFVNNIFFYITSHYVALHVLQTVFSLLRLCVLSLEEKKGHKKEGYTQD